MDDTEAGESGSRSTQSVLEVTPDPTLVVDIDDLAIVAANDAAATLLGSDAESLRGRPIVDFTASAPARTDSDPAGAIETGIDAGAHRFECQLERTDGARRWVDVSLKRATLDGRERLVAAIRDVTDRRGETDLVETDERERRLAAHQERMETVLDNAPIVLFVFDDEGVFTDSRGNGLTKLGLEPGEAVGTTVFEMYDDAPEVLDDCKRALAGDRVESNVQLGDVHYHTVYQPVFDENGNVEQVIGVSRDVTDLRERERELEAWQDRLQTVLDNAPLALFSYDSDGTVTLSQGRGLDSFGLEPGELVGQNLFDVYAEQTDLVSDLERALDGEEFTTVRELGATIFRTWYRPVTSDGDVTQVIAVSIDITEQKRQERRIEAISEATNELITAESRTAVGEHVMELADELLDMPLSGIWTNSDDSAGLTPMAATETVLDRMDTRTATEALVDIDPGTVEMAAFEAGETHVIEDYGTVENPTHPEAPLGTLVIVPLGEYGQLHVGTSDVSVPSKAERNIIEILATNAEAALERAQREAELETYREELEQSNERLQQFAYIASHDLQEPLRMVSSYVDLLAMEYGDQLDDEADEYIEFAVDGAERMQSMIEDLLQYSRVQTKAGDFTPLDTEGLVAETLQNLELAIEEAEATVTVESVPDVSADRDQLRQVFQNLVANAVEHGGDASSVTVRGSEADDHYRFEVEDDGPGIPEDQHERLFKIFQQGDRNDDSGTGIGLAVCERIVSRHGGDIWIESEPGDGSTFCFTIDKETTEDDSMTTVQTSDSDGN